MPLKLTRGPDMCGIAGIAGHAREEIVAQMCMRMVHRGPDDSGTWSDPAVGVALGHRRLSIIDLSRAGHQPMLSDDGLLALVYNGEIYNYMEHRDALGRDGVQFKSQTDTEVLLRLYERYGISMLGMLNGMFAFALWDGRARKLILVRDHAGIKPLYYWMNGEQLAFASEIKALLVAPGLRRRMNVDVLHAYLGLLWVPGEQTMLHGVMKVEPGHYVEWQDGKMTIRRWFELNWQADESVSESDWVEQVRDTFVKTTRRQMVSDVPLAAFLSGGIDSSSIVACMREAFPDRPIKAYTAAFPTGQISAEQGADDLPYARQAARHLGVNLQEIQIAPKVVSMLPVMVYHLDEPDADPAVFPSYLIADAARRNGSKVLLSGTGGDEVFFGYRSHQAMHRFAQLDRDQTGLARAGAVLGTALLASVFGKQHRWSRRSRKFLRGMLAETGVERHIALVDWSDAGLREKLVNMSLGVGGVGNRRLNEALLPYARSFTGNGAINMHSHLLINSFLASHNFLYTDKSSMAASVEVRVPFLDVELMQLAAKIPEAVKLRNGTAKYVLKRAMEPLLPSSLIYRSKTGFGVPLRHWLRTDLQGLVRDLLGPETIRRRGIFAPTAVQQILTENETGAADHAYLIYALIVLEVWTMTFLDKPGAVASLQD